MYTQIFSCFVVGLLIGFLTFNLFSFNQSYDELPASKVPKVLCVILTSSRSHSQKAVHVRMTWGKHCDKLIFMSVKTDTNLGAIGFNVRDDYNSVWGKVKEAFHYVHRNFIDDYDWVYKGDDDSFAILENMRHMLASYSPQDPIYFGHRFQTNHHKYGYFSGGSGYVMSNKAVRLFAEKILTNHSLCKVNFDNGSEDYNMGECLELVGVYPVDSRDPAKRERFLPFIPEHHLLPHYDPTFWYWSYNYYKTSEGLDCCSNYTATMHYITPKYMYALYFLTYHLRLFGVKRRFPTAHTTFHFSDIVQAAKNDKKIRDKINASGK